MSCGNRIPDPLEIQSHVMFLMLSTPGLAFREGFRILYSADNEEICGGILDGNSGAITSYRFGESNYTETMNCVWDISIPNNGVNYSVAFSFDVFEIPPPSSYCNNGVFKISYYNCKFICCYSQ
jgi:hypothetical protein